MTLDESSDILKSRPPTPDDIRRFVDSQPGWTIRKLSDGRPALRVKDVTDVMAVNIAKLCGREPYRSHFTALLNSPTTATPAELVVLPPTAEKDDTPRTCQRCKATVWPGRLADGEGLATCQPAMRTWLGLPQLRPGVCPYQAVVREQPEEDQSTPEPIRLAYFPEAS